MVIYGKEFDQTEIDAHNCYLRIYLSLFHDKTVNNCHHDSLSVQAIDRQTMIATSRSCYRRGELHIGDRVSITVRKTHQWADLTIAPSLAPVRLAERFARNEDIVLT